MYVRYSSRPIPLDSTSSSPHIRTSRHRRLSPMLLQLGGHARRMEKYILHAFQVTLVSNSACRSPWFPTVVKTHPKAVGRLLESRFNGFDVSQQATLPTTYNHETCLRPAGRLLRMFSSSVRFTGDCASESLCDPTKHEVGTFSNTVSSDRR